MEKNVRELIVKTFKEKTSIKQEVIAKTTHAFSEFKSIIKKVATELRSEASKIDKRIIIDYIDKNEFEIELIVAEDILIFNMHSNVFEIDKSHTIWKTSYAREDPTRCYCGMVNVYNFLSDSFKYNRLSDVGYLIERIYINHENHYFIEGKKQLGFQHNDFPSAILTKENIYAIIEAAILYSLEFELYTPSFEAVKEVSVNDIQREFGNVLIQTGKRLGFKFQAEDESLL